MATTHKSFGRPINKEGREKNAWGRFCLLVNFAKFAGNGILKSPPLQTRVHSTGAALFPIFYCFYKEKRKTLMSNNKKFPFRNEENAK